MFKDACPECDEKELEVVAGGFVTEGLRLGKDGFSFMDAHAIYTEDEKVKCRCCGAEFMPSELTE